jgi:hypothetical protein
MIIIINYILLKTASSKIVRQVRIKIHAFPKRCIPLSLYFLYLDLNSVCNPETAPTMVSLSSQDVLDSPQKKVRVSVEIPTCDSLEDGHEVTILVSPKKPLRSNNPSGNAPAYSEIEPIIFNTTSSAVYSSAFETTTAIDATNPSVPPSTTAIVPPSVPPSATAIVSPSTIVTSTAIVYDSEEEDVFGTIKGPSREIGRKEKRWYLITRGRKVGVFFKFWYAD